MATTQPWAGALVAARLSRTRLAAAAMPPTTLSLSDAYTTLGEVESQLNAKGWPTAAYKVGATSATIQQRLGIAEPFWGPIFKPALVQARGNRDALRFSVSGDLIRGVEAELAFVVAKDIEPRAKKYSSNELLGEYATTFVPSVEVCASRLPPSSPLSAAFTIADSAGNGAIVLEKTATRPSVGVVDLAKIKTWIKIDGEVVAHGSGAEVMGHPGSALEWFIDVIVGKHKRVVPRGMVISSGATCGLVPITKPCYVAVEFGTDENDSNKTIVHLAFRK